MKKQVVLLLAALLLVLPLGVASANAPNKVADHCTHPAPQADKANAAKQKAQAKEYAAYGEFEYWIEAGNLVEAEKVFKKLKTDEKRQEAIDALANYYVTQGDFKAAIRWAAKIKNEACRLQVVENISTEAYRRMLKQLLANDLTGAEETAGAIKYPPRREAATYTLAIKYIGIGDFVKAEVLIKQLTDNEKKQLALYNLAVEGYTARGELDKAFATLDQELFPLFGKNGENRSVPKREHILKDMAIVATVNKYGLPEATARSNAMKVLSQIDNIYYRLMALEASVLYMNSDKMAEALLLDAGYKRAGDPLLEETEIGPLAVVSYSKEDGRIIIFVKYGIEEGTGTRPFQVDRWLDEENRKEFDALMQRDEQMQKYLAEQKKQDEEQKSVTDAEKDLGGRYQKFLEDPTDPANKFTAPDPAAPQDNHHDHGGHGGMHH